MKVCKCDRCGAYVDKDSIPMVRGYFNPEASGVSGKLLPEDFKMQLCYECYDKLLRFLKGDEDAT